MIELTTKHHIRLKIADSFVWAEYYWRAGEPHKLKLHPDGQQGFMSNHTPLNQADAGNVSYDGLIDYIKDHHNG